MSNTAARLGLNGANSNSSWGLFTSLSHRFFGESNISLYGIPIFFLASIAPHAIKVVLLSKNAKFDNLNPRNAASEDTIERLGRAKGLRDSDVQSLKNACSRLSAIHYNSLETFPFFAATVLAGNIAGLPSSALSTYTLGFLTSRLLFNLAYFYQNSDALAWARSGFYWYGILSSVGLFWKAAKVIHERIL